MSSELIERLREKDREGYSELFGLAADALEAAASRERELEARTELAEVRVVDLESAISLFASHEFMEQYKALERDAKRYRWLRQAGAWESELGIDALCKEPESFDAAVDAAMAGEK